MSDENATKPPQRQRFPASERPGEETEPGVLRRAASPRLTRAVQAQIGERLRLFYETLNLGEEPVPERFIEIIDRLAEAEHREKRS